MVNSNNLQVIIMPANITFESFIGKNPDPLQAIQIGEVNGTANCEKVKVQIPIANLVVEVNVRFDHRYTAVFDLTGKGIKCGDVVKISVACENTPGCTINAEAKVECSPIVHSSPRYVLYYNCISWDSNVQVMNLQESEGKFIITLYRRNGNLVWQKSITAKPHETIRIYLDRYSPRDEGLVVVEPENEGWEFPSVLCITNTKDIVFPSNLGNISKTQLHRFVPFIRIH